MYRKGLMALFVALLVPVFVLFFAGCGGDDDDNPADAGDGGNGNGDDTLTTQEVVDEVQDVFGSLEDLTVECDALLLLEAEGTGDELFFLLEVMTEIMGDTLGTVSLSDYFGTWEDTTEADDSEGVGRTSLLPANAFVLLVDGVDSTDAEVSGNLTLNSLSLDLDEADSTLSIAASASLNMDGGGSASLDFSVTIDASALSSSLDPDSIDALPGIVLTMSGDICGLEMEINLSTESGQLVLTGYYELEGERISFSMESDFDPDAGTQCVTVELWEGASQAETEFYLTTTMCPTDLEDCLTGSIEIDGVEEVTFWIEDCTDTTSGVTMEINGEFLTGDEVFEEFADLFEQLWGIDADDILKTGPQYGHVNSKRFSPIRNNPALFLSREFVNAMN